MISNRTFSPWVGWQNEHNDGRFRRMSILDQMRQSRSVLPGSGDHGVRRVRVGNVSSVSAATADFSLDWLLAVVEAAHYRQGGILT